MTNSNTSKFYNFTNPTPRNSDDTHEQRFMQSVIAFFNHEGLLAYNDTNDNDLCDSIAIIWKGDGIKQKIFFPNSNINNPDNEEFNTFQVQNQRIDDETTFGELYEFYDIEEVIQYVMNC